MELEPTSLPRRQKRPGRAEAPPPLPALPGARVPPARAGGRREAGGEEAGGAEAPRRSAQQQPARPPACRWMRRPGEPGDNLACDAPRGLQGPRPGLPPGGPALRGYRHPLAPSACQPAGEDDPPVATARRAFLGARAARARARRQVRARAPLQRPAAALRQAAPGSALGARAPSLPSRPSCVDRPLQPPPGRQAAAAAACFHPSGRSNLDAERMGGKLRMPMRLRRARAAEPSCPALAQGASPASRGPRRPFPAAREPPRLDRAPSPCEPAAALPAGGAEARRGGAGRRAGRAALRSARLPRGGRPRRQRRNYGRAARSGAGGRLPCGCWRSAGPGSGASHASLSPAAPQPLPAAARCPRRRAGHLHVVRRFPAAGGAGAGRRRLPGEVVKRHILSRLQMRGRPNITHAVPKAAMVTALQAARGQGARGRPGGDPAPRRPRCPGADGPERVSEIISFAETGGSVPRAAPATPPPASLFAGLWLPLSPQPARPGGNPGLLARAARSPPALWRPGPGCGPLSKAATPSCPYPRRGALCPPPLLSETGPAPLGASPSWRGLQALAPRGTAW